MARTLSDLVTTVLVLNAASSYIRGSAELPVFLTTIRTPPFRVSLLLLLAWIGGGLLLRHHERLRTLPVGAYVCQRIPEMIVGVLFIIGLAMRLIGIGFGNPLILHPDEHVVVGASIFMLKEGSLAHTGSEDVQR
jgi:hypothetical protein